MLFALHERQHISTSKAMSNKTTKPRKYSNTKTKSWLKDLYGQKLPHDESEEAVINLVNYFKTLKEISHRKVELDAINQARHTKSNVKVK